MTLLAVEEVVGLAMGAELLIWSMEVVARETVDLGGSFEAGDSEYAPDEVGGCPVRRWSRSRAFCLLAAWS